MTIQVYPFDEKEEKELLDFLESRHYRYQSAEENPEMDAEFIAEYNKELAEAEAEIDAGDYLTHGEVKRSLAERRKQISGS